MSGEAFIDTNVLVYLLGSDDRKAAVANAVLAAGGVISVQVLNEFANVARRKAGLDWAELNEMLVIFKQAFEVRPVDLATHESGVRIAERSRLSLYDAMIVAAALQADCKTVYSEDMQDGMAVGGVTVRNPFQT